MKTATDIEEGNAMYEAYYIIEKFGQEFVSGWTKSTMRKVFGMPDTETKRVVNEVFA